MSQNGRSGGARTWRDPPTHGSSILYVPKWTVSRSAPVHHRTGAKRRIQGGSSTLYVPKWTVRRGEIHLHMVAPYCMSQNGRSVGAHLSIIELGPSDVSKAVAPRLYVPKWTVRRGEIHLHMVAPYCMSQNGRSVGAYLSIIELGPSDVSKGSSTLVCPKMDGQEWRDPRTHGSSILYVPKWTVRRSAPVHHRTGAKLKNSIV
jgi:hypothetical protein